MGDGIIGNLFGAGREEKPSEIAENKRILFKAVVVDIGVFNPAVEWTERQDFSQIVDPASQSLVEQAPRNSILARVISNGKGVTENKAILCYPFFPPHICFPVKAGETVWVINEQVGVLGKIPYWICRVPEMMRVDDINYTHEDRKIHPQHRDLEALEALFDDPANLDVGIILPGFPNGGGTSSNFTLAQPRNSPNKYDQISDLSIGMKAFKYQPVPRFSKRPGDTVLQGSNNTLICLGEDRGWSWYEDLKDEITNAYSPANAQDYNPKGTIDIVAGRGRYQELATTQQAFGDPPVDTTSARLIENQRGFIEVDKYPESNGLDQPGERNNNPPGATANESLEGDPDFLSDAARVYVSENSYGDTYFGITQTTFTPEVAGDEEEIIGYTPERFTGKKMATSLVPNYSFIDHGNQSFVVNKADHIRLIARKQVNPDADNASIADPDSVNKPRSSKDANYINGSIRIIKEGDKNLDLGLVAIRPDGSIQISGSKIYMGRAPEDGGFEGEHNQGPGDETLKDLDPPEDPGVTQPWVKYQQLEDLFNALFDDIKDFCNKMKTHTTPGYGSPSIQINDACTALAKAAEDRRSEIERLKSKRIFGE